MDNKNWTVNLPYPPSSRRLYERRRGTAAVYMSQEGRNYKEAVSYIIAAEGLPVIPGFVRVKIEMYPPDKRKRDIDNILKITLDALEDSGVIEDDSKIITLWVNKNAPVKGGGLDVSIRPAHEEFKAFIAEKAGKTPAEKVNKLWGVKL